MKKNHPITLGLLLLFLPVIASADDATDTDALLTALGAYLGYDLASTDDPALKSPVATLLDAAGAALAQQSAVVTELGAIPVNAASEAASQFVPSGSTYAPINSMSNYTFSGQSGTPAYNTVSSSGDGAVTVTNLIDQSDYQKDPISQAVLNILGTPNYTSCMDNADPAAWLPDFMYKLYNTQVTNNVIGTPLGNTGDTAFFTFASNAALIPQLNSNTLIAPLLYNTSAAEPSTGSTPPPPANGLASTNQMQDAANFIRYASYMVTPVPLPLQKEYANALTMMNDSTVSATNRSDAQASITSYLTSLRVYAAQVSVPISNLYAILSKRMPQQNDSNTATQTSQALSEFQMATRRLANPVDKSNQWIDQINAASSGTVQKEIAILLAEINYQLYLTRQQEERQLLTTSIMLLQAAYQHPPSFDTSAVTNAATPDAPTTQ